MKNIHKNDNVLYGILNKEIDRELYNAMLKIKNEGIGPKEQFNSFGCSIKWKNNE